MKKTIYFLAIFALMSACTSGKQKTDNNEQQTAETTTAELTETNMEKRADISYTQCPLAYLIEGELYFYNDDDNIKVKFVEETEPIFNFTFDTEGETLYYSAERNNQLWLKKAILSNSIVTPDWVHDWCLEKDNETNDYPNQLYFSEVVEPNHKGELLLEYQFDISYNDFRKFEIYNIATEQSIIGDKYSDQALIEKFKPEVSEAKSGEYFETTREQLYYTRNNVKVCLTDKLDINGLKNKYDIDYGIKTQFSDYTFSPDETKILFRALLGNSEDTFHGPYCIANADGSNQFILEQATASWEISPAWLKNNKIAFTDREENLYVANNKDNSVQKIAENVSVYLGR